MHRRRATLFEPLLAQLNPNVYLVPLRQMMFDIGDVYSDIVDLRVGEKHPAAKINESCVIVIRSVGLRCAD
jgi:hypothetical protein